MSTPNPVEVDTALEALYIEQSKIDQRISRAIETIHNAAGDRRQNTRTIAYKRAPWGLSLDEAITNGPKQPWDARSHANGVANLEQARSEMEANHAAIGELNEIWLANGRWSRFFEVRAGHIHSSMDCKTCNNGQDPTEFGWLPELSGLTEADAVKARGPKLCTVCFPSAPLNWTNFYEETAAAKKAAQCPGSGTYDYDSKTARTGYVHGNAGTCNQCGQRITTTTTGKLRTHKPKAAK